MINVTVNARRMWLIAALLLFPICITSMQAQELDFKYKIDSVKIGNAMEYNATVTVNKEIGPFNYAIYEGFPWNNGSLLQLSENIKSTTYTFKKLQSKKLYLIVLELHNNKDVVTRKSFKIN